MIVLGLAYASALWFLAAHAMVNYELHVHVLPPWQRKLYAVAAFAARLMGR